MLKSQNPVANRELLDCSYRADRPWITLLRLYKNERRALLTAAFWYAIKSSPQWVLPIVIATIVDAFAKPKNQALPLILWAGAGGALILGQNVVTHLLYFKKLSQATRSVEAKLRMALCQRVQELSIAYFRFASAGTLQSKVIRDVENLDQMVRQLIEVFFNAVVMLSATLLITSFRAPWFLPFYFLTVPLVVTIRQTMQRRLKTTNQEFRENIEEVTASVSGMIEMVPLTRAHALEDVELEKLRQRIERLRMTGQSLDEQTAIFGSISWALFNGVYLLGLVLAAAAAVMKFIPMTAGEILMVSGFFNSISNAVLGLANAMPILTRGFESVRSIGDILECPDLEQNQNKPDIAEVRGEFVIENVYFAYPNKEEAPALNNVSLHVPAGRTVAFIGPSGSGKSTLMGLILGFYRPTTGRILLDGNDMNGIDLRSYRKHLAVVSQETVLFPGTIRENILYGSNHVSEAALEKVLNEANALEFVKKLPQGLDTVVGEHGSTLSGGQRQRIAIARALIRNPRVLILDEATSALDVNSEALVQEALDRLMIGRTTFIVAHRLSTIRHAEVIVAMENGEVVEVGTPQELLMNPNSRFATASALAGSHLG